MISSGISISDNLKTQAVGKHGSTSNKKRYVPPFYTLRAFIAPKRTRRRFVVHLIYRRTRSTFSSQKTILNYFYNIFNNVEPVTIEEVRGSQSIVAVNNIFHRDYVLLTLRYMRHRFTLINIISLQSLSKTIKLSTNVVSEMALNTTTSQPVQNEDQLSPRTSRPRHTDPIKLIMCQSINRHINLLVLSRELGYFRCFQRIPILFFTSRSSHQFNI